MKSIRIPLGLALILFSTTDLLPLRDTLSLFILDCFLCLSVELILGCLSTNFVFLDCFDLSLSQSTNFRFLDFTHTSTFSSFSTTGDDSVFDDCRFLSSSK